MIGTGWVALTRIFRKAPQPAPGSPIAEQVSTNPPPLAPAKERYILYKCGDGVFDVYDGAQMIGDLYRQEGAGGRDTVWVVTLYNAHYDRFRSLKAVKEWLGGPPVRKYRRCEAEVAKSRRGGRKAEAHPSSKRP
jgi:hypothetical protein